MTGNKPKRPLGRPLDNAAYASADDGFRGMESQMLNYTRNGKTYAVDPNQLPAEAIAYLLQYGWAQSLQDSIAGREKRVRDELEAKVANNIEQLDDDEIAEQIAMDIDGQLSKRADAIIAGTIGTRSIGEPRDPLKAVAADMIRKAAAKQGKKLSKEQLAKFVEQALADDDKRAKIKAEYDRRKESEIDLDI